MTIDNRYQRYFARHRNMQDSEKIKQRYKSARIKHLRTKNKILIVNEMTPHQLKEKIDYTLRKDLTDINLEKGCCSSFSLSGFNLTKLPCQSIWENKKLKRIDLSNNLLKHLSPKTFEGLDFLNKLNLSNNHLVEFSLALLGKLPNLKFLNLENNPLNIEFVTKLKAFCKFNFDKLQLKI